MSPNEDLAVMASAADVVDSVRLTIDVLEHQLGALDQGNDPYVRGRAYSLRRAVDMLRIDLGMERT